MNPGATEKDLERHERARKKGFGVFEPRPSAPPKSKQKPTPAPKPRKPFFGNPFESDAAIQRRLKKQNKK
jgi:hypothetical protein